MFVVCFDLEESGDYHTAYEILRQLGLHPVSPTATAQNRPIHLPNTTVMGSYRGTSAMLHSHIVQRFAQASLPLTRLLVALVNDWFAA